MKEKNLIQQISNGLDGMELERVIEDLSELSQKRERELAELDRIAKLLVRRDLALTEMREEQAKQLWEMDRIAKMLVRRDFALSEIKEKREEEFSKLQKRTKELDDSRRALVNILEDVEEARARASEEKDKTLAIITNFTDGLLVFDKEGILTLINPRAEEFFEVNYEQVMGRHIPELKKESKALRALVKVLGKQIKKLFRKEIALTENLILEASTVPVLREKEKLGTLVILHDITREKLIEKMKTEFVSLAAHQLRTPVSAIKWTLRMLLDGDLGKITGEQRDFMEKTYLSNERLIHLINDLLDVTRIEEGKYLYNPTFTQIENIVQFVLNSYKEEIKKRKVKIEFKKPEKKLPSLRIDVEKIRLAVQNLLDNALRYTPAGGEITVSLRQANSKIVFKVKDTGIGIPEDQKQRVFNKFFRGANAIRMETEGSGLGLYITKNIIEAHGGKIWFESEEGKGTTFFFSLPTKEEFAEFLKEF